MTLFSAPLPSPSPSPSPSPPHPPPSPSPSPLPSKPHLNLNQPHPPSTSHPPPRVKVPPAPWMTKPPHPLPDPPDPASRPPSTARSLTKRIPNGRTRKTVSEIIRSVKSLQRSDPMCRIQDSFDATGGIGNWDDEAEAEEDRPNLPWVGGRSERDGDIMVFRREKKKREATEAEKRIAPEELQRLRLEGRRIRRSLYSSNKFCTIYLLLYQCFM